MTKAKTGSTSFQELIRKKRSALSAFAAWEASHQADVDVSQVFASLGAIYELIPPEHRGQRDDPERRGVRIMHERLAALS
jgi:hypothetical protein